MGFRVGRLMFTCLLHHNDDRVLVIDFFDKNRFDAVYRLTDKNVLYENNGRKSFDKVTQEEWELYNSCPNYSISELNSAINNGILVIGKKERCKRCFS